MGHSGVISVNVQALYSTALNTRSSLLIASRKLTPCCKEVALSVDVHGGALSVDHGQYHRRRVVCGLWTVPCPLSPQRCAPHTPLEKPSPQGSVATSTARPLASIVPFIAWGGPCRTSRSRDVVCGEGGHPVGTIDWVLGTTWSAFGLEKSTFWSFADLERRLCARLPNLARRLSRLDPTRTRTGTPPLKPPKRC